jgi:transcriptional regulator with XRE-family HTH domain
MMTNTRTNDRSARRSELGERIPEEIQQPMRERLRLMRLTRNMHLSSIEKLSAGALGQYERQDLSTMQLRHLYALAEAFGVEFQEFVTALFSEAPSHLTSKRNRNVSTMLRLLDLLDEDDQTLACRMVDNLVDARVSNITQGVKRRAYSRRS